MVQWGRCGGRPRVAARRDGRRAGSYVGALDGGDQAHGKLDEVEGVNPHQDRDAADDALAVHSRARADERHGEDLGPGMGHACKEVPSYA